MRGLNIYILEQRSPLGKIEDDSFLFAKTFWLTECMSNDYILFIKFNLLCTANKKGHIYDTLVHVMNMLEWVGVIVCYKFAETVTNMLKVPSFYKNGLRTDFLPSDMILLDKFVFVFTNLFMNDFLILPFLFTISSWSTVQFIHESISQITPISNYQKLLHFISTPEKGNSL